MNWQLPLMVYLVMTTVVSLQRRHLGRTLDDYNRIVNAVFYVGILFPLGFITAIIMGTDFHIGWQNFALLVAGQAVFPVTTLLMYKASKHIDAGSLTILNNLTPVITIAAAWVFLSDKLSSMQIVGGAVILASAFLVSVPQIKKRHITRADGLSLALLSISVVGVGLVYERYMLGRMDLGAYLTFGWGMQAFWMAVIAWPQRHKLAILRQRDTAFHIYAYGLAYTLAGLGYVTAVKLSGNISLISSIIGFRTVLIVLAAMIFLREKTWIWLKLAAAAIGTAGLIIIAQH